jgi:site-specific DNA-adenine methylase
VNRQLPSIDDGEWGERIRLYMRQLCARLRRVRVCCGDWRRVLTPTVTEAHGMTAVFLDPPYAVEDRDSVYGDDDSKTLAHDVRAWCIENGDNPLLRTALCGYEEHNEMEAHGWTRHAWKARGGYGSNNKRDNANAGRETIWFSPRCLGADNDMFNTKGANEDENETDYRSNHVV